MQYSRLGSFLRAEQPRLIDFRPTARLLLTRNRWGQRRDTAARSVTNLRPGVGYPARTKTAGNDACFPLGSFTYDPPIISLKNVMELFEVKRAARDFTKPPVNALDGREQTY
jgi:hypothetical protein